MCAKKCNKDAYNKILPVHDLQPFTAKQNGEVSRETGHRQRVAEEIARLGFEPKLSESESLVLPLHYQAKMNRNPVAGRKYNNRSHFAKADFTDFSRQPSKKSRGSVRQCEQCNG